MRVADHERPSSLPLSGRGSLLTGVALAGVFLLLVVSGAGRAAAPGAEIAYIHDEVGRLVAVSDPAGETATYSYDAVGNVLSISRRSSALVSAIHFFPRSGPAGTTVTIHGTAFSTTASQNTVKFNGTVAATSSATKNRLVAVVPAGATTGLISVTTPAGTASTTQPFTVAPAKAPSIASLTPGSGAPDTAVTIAGSNFETALANNKVSFNGTLARVTAATATSLTALVPRATSGHVSVATPEGGATSSGDFFVAPPGFAAGDIEFTDRMAVGTSKTATIGGAGRIGLVVFDGTAGQRLSVRLSNDTLGSSYSCGAAIRIYTPAGATLAENTCVQPAAPPFFDTMTLSDAGTYTILVDPSGTNTGSITLALSEVPADASGTITPGGGAQTLSMATAGQNGQLTFTATEGQRLSLGLSNDTIGSGYASTATVAIKQGATTVESRGVVPVQPPFFDSRVYTAGTYTILVDPVDANTGSLTLTLYDVPADASAPATIGGPAVWLTTTVPGQNASAPFASVGGETVTATFSGSTIPSFTRVKIMNGSTELGSTLIAGSGGSLSAGVLAACGCEVVIDPDAASTGSITVALTATSGLSGSAMAPATGLSLLTAAPTTPAETAGASTSPPAVEPSDPSENAAAATREEEAGARRFEATDPEDWTPNSKDRGGFWQAERAESPLTSLPPLQAAPGTTAVAGQVLKLNGAPLAGVHLSLELQHEMVGHEGMSHEAVSDETGRFLIQHAPEGHHTLVIDGIAAGSGGASYGLFEVGVAVGEGKTNVLPYTIWLPRIDKARAVGISSPTTKETVVTTPQIPGLELHIPAGSTLRDRDGKPVTEVSITPIPVDRTPFPLAIGVDVPVYFTIQPGGAEVLGASGAHLVYPNYRNRLPGTRVEFWRYRPQHGLDEHYGLGGWYVYGKGRVTPDGEQVAPDPGVAFRRFTGAMINDGENPPGKGPRDGDKKKDGDPVDLATGIFAAEKTDLVLPDVLPLALTRTYRSQDTESRSFGIATTHQYDTFLWSAQQYQEADLILPDGGRVHYVRTSPGTGFADAVFESTSPSGYFKSRITWNGAGYTLRLKDGTTYVFGENAPLQSIRDRFGNTITLTREGTNAFGNQIGEITQITSSNGRWIRLTYDTAKRITRADDNIGRAVIYQYDASGRLWKVIDAGGKVTEYGYSAVAGATHRLLTIKDPRGFTYLTNEYDANGRVTKQTQADATIYRFAYTLDGNGNVTQTEVTDPRLNIRRVAFNAAGYATADTLAVGKPEQQQTAYELEPGTNLLLSETDALGRKTAYGYDAIGNVTTVTELTGTPEAVTSTFSYDPAFNGITSVKDPLNQTTSYVYDTAGRLQETVDALGKRTSYAYNAAGQPVSIRDPLTNETLFRYEQGELVETTDPLGRKATRFLDAAGRVVAVTDATGARSRTEYDPQNQVTKATNSRGDATTFGYDANGNLTTLTDARGKVTTWVYDSMDRVSSRKDPLLKTESFIYDGNGNMTRFTDRRAKITNYTFDALGRRLTAVFASPAGTITYTYDPGNRITKAVDTVGGTIDHTYDKLDRLTLETSPRGSISYVYDKAGRRTSMTVAGQTAVTYAYDLVGQPTQVARGATAAAAAYDDAGRPTSLTLPNAVVQGYAYDQASQLTAISYTKGASTLGDLGYGYDSAGRRVAASGSFARTAMPTAVTTTAYDNGNHLTKWGTPTLTYDLNGNVTKDASAATYTWNNRNELASIAGTGLTASFTYDAFGRRAKATVNGATTQFLSDGSNVVQEQSSTGVATANLLTGLGVDSLLARTEGAVTRSLLTDGLGSTLALADAAGAIQTSYTYEPFGKATTTGTASTNKNQFTGRENDGATGLQFNRARYYNPSYGRFVSEDPLGFAGGDVNLYAYVGNSPFNFTDPYGLCGSIPILDLVNAVQGRCGAAEGIFIVASYTPWGRVARIARAASRAAQGARGVSRASDGVQGARGVPRPVSGGAPSLADLPPNARTTGSFNEVARRLGKNHGIDRNTASERLHEIKAATGRGPADNVIFDLTGNVYDPRTGELLGSLTEGGARRVAP